MTDVPAERLTASGHVASSDEEIKFDGLNARLAGAQVKADGTLRLARDRDADVRFELSAENLLKLRKGLPDIALVMSGNFSKAIKVRTQGLQVAYWQDRGHRIGVIGAE